MNKTKIIAELKEGLLHHAIFVNLNKLQYYLIFFSAIKGLAATPEAYYVEITSNWHWCNVIMSQLR